MKDRVDKSRGIVEALTKIKPTEVSQTGSAQRAKLIRFLGQFSGQSNNLTVSMQEKQT